MVIEIRAKKRGIKEWESCGLPLNGNALQELMKEGEKRDVVVEVKSPKSVKYYCSSEKLQSIMRPKGEVMPLASIRENPTLIRLDSTLLPCEELEKLVLLYGEIRAEAIIIEVAAE